MERNVVFLFGEAEKGEFCVPILCQSLSQLFEYLGHPPDDTLGIFYGIQALMNRWNLLYFRVEEEGFSATDYYRGIHFLESSNITSQVGIVSIPGVGNQEIINRFDPFCHKQNILLMINERDFYDYVTSHGSSKL